MADRYTSEPGPRKVAGETDGGFTEIVQVRGGAADGDPVAGNPVLIAGKDGSGNAQTLLVGTDGAIPFGGQAADGAPVTGNPVRIGGKDGSNNTQDLSTDTNGRANVNVVDSLPAGDNNIGNVDVVTLPALPAGTNNIGDVDVLTLPALPAGTNNIGDVDVVTLPALPAGSNTIGATLDAGPAWTPSRGVDGVPVESANLNSATAVTDAPTSGQKLVIDDVFVGVDAAMNILFETETGGVNQLRVYFPGVGNYQFTPRSKWKLPTADQKLTAIASAAGNVSILAFYHSEA